MKQMNFKNLLININNIQIDDIVQKEHLWIRIINFEQLLINYGNKRNHQPPTREEQLDPRAVCRAPSCHTPGRQPLGEWTTT